MELLERLYEMVGIWHLMSYIVIMLLSFILNIYIEESWTDQISDYVDKYKRVFIFNGIYSLCKLLFIIMWVLLFPLIFLIKVMVLEFNIGWFFKRIK